MPVSEVISFGDARLPAKFWGLVSPAESGCWLYFGGAAMHGGYGLFWDGAGSRPVHRLAYSALVGEIPVGLFVCHRCDQPACVNPEHLWLGSNSENQKDSVRKGRHHSTRKTHCPRGHAYDESNTKRYRGGRYCRACALAW